MIVILCSNERCNTVCTETITIFTEKSVLTLRIVKDDMTELPRLRKLTSPSTLLNWFKKAATYRRFTIKSPTLLFGQTALYILQTFDWIVCHFAIVHYKLKYKDTSFCILLLYNYCVHKFRYTVTWLTMLQCNESEGHNNLL